MNATKLLCDCCKRELISRDGSIGHESDAGEHGRYSRGWCTARRMLFGVYWCSVCVGKMDTPKVKPDWLKTPKPLFKAAESFRLAEVLSGWLTRLQPLYDRSGWDYGTRLGWHPTPATRAAFARVGQLLIESGNLSLVLKPLEDGDMIRNINGNRLDAKHKTPEFLWEHFGKSLAGLFRNLQPADAKRLRAIWKTF